MTPKHGLYWCHGCDAVLITDAIKCPVCGSKPKRKMYKKETNAR